MKNNTFCLILVSLLGLAFLHPTQAVSPSPDGGYPGFNTAEGQNALLSLDTSTGFGNTAVGWFSLRSTVFGSFNTAIGAGTLLSNLQPKIRRPELERSSPTPPVRPILRRAHWLYSRTRAA